MRLVTGVMSTRGLLVVLSPTVRKSASARSNSDPVLVLLIFSCKEFDWSSKNWEKKETD